MLNNKKESPYGAMLNFCGIFAVQTAVKLTSSKHWTIWENVLLLNLLLEKKKSVGLYF